MSGYIGTQPVPQATQTRDSFTATSGQTSFATGGYTPNFLDVYLNGVKLASADYTATNGSDVVLASGASTGDILEVVAYTAFDTANVTGATDFTVTGSFTSQGIDDNANATALTIDSNENVLIGKTTTSFGTQGVALRNNRIQSTNDGGSPLELNRLTSDGDIALFQKDGSTVGSIGNPFSNAMYITGPTSTGSGFVLQNDNKIYPAKAGARVDNYVDLGGSVFRYKDAYLSGGVYLGGTGSANKLDDYEEGTWTPSIKVEVAGPAGITVNHATYTKIGRLVSLVFDLTINSVTGTSSSRAIQLEGMPFTINTAYGGGPNIGYTNLTNSMSGNLALQGRLNNRYRIVNLNGATGQNASDHIQASTVLRGQFIYHTDQ